MPAAEIVPKAEIAPKSQGGNNKGPKHQGGNNKGPKGDDRIQCSLDKDEQLIQFGQRFTKEQAEKVISRTLAQANHHTRIFIEEARKPGAELNLIKQAYYGEQRMQADIFEKALSDKELSVKAATVTVLVERKFAKSNATREAANDDVEEGTVIKKPSETSATLKALAHLLGLRHNKIMSLEDEPTLVRAADAAAKRSRTQADPANVWTDFK